MVWFQCEDCGENLKKPKLANHFRTCSAYKLSCIDCGEMFTQQSVQNHTQCITETEKYGPKGQGNVSHNGKTKPDKPKKNSDVDINVGLSSYAPWFCSLCNTHTTSKQTLQLHADGKKHRAKARAFHAAQKQSSQMEELNPNEEVVGNGQKVESAEANGSNDKIQESDLRKDAIPIAGGEKEKHTRKRKVDANEDGLNKKSEKKSECDLTDGEVIQTEQSEESQHKSKKKKGADKQGLVMEASDGKIKWKKLITSILKSSEGVMKIKRLQKLILKALKESGVTKNEDQLRDKLMQKVTSSTRFTIENRHICLAAKT